MIQGSAAAAEAGIRPNRFIDESLGPRDGASHSEALRETCGDRCRQSAARAMRMPCVDAPRGEFEKSLAIEKHVDRAALAMAAFDQDGSRAHLMERAGSFAHVAA